MKVFELFGEILLKGDQAVAAGLKTVDEQAKVSAENIKKYGKAISSAGETMSKWVTGPMVAIGAGLVGLTNSVAQYGDRVNDLAAITGMSTQAIQEYQHAAKVAGTDTEAVTKTMRIFSAQLDQIAKGTGPVAEAFQRLGIETDAFIQMSPDQQMAAMISALQEIPDPAERARIGVELFSRQWEQLAPIVGLGADALRDAQEAAGEFALDEEQLASLDGFRLAMVDLQAEITGMMNKLGAELAPVLTEFVASIKENGLPVLESMAKAVVSVMNGFMSLPGPVQSFIVVLTGVLAAAGPVLVVIGQLITAWGVVSGAVSAASGVFAVIAGVIGTVAAPVLAVVAAVAALIAIWYNWDEIVRGSEVLWDMIKDGAESSAKALTEFGADALDVFVDLATAIPRKAHEMGEKVAEAIKEMVAQSIAALKRLYQEAVGNSIIPDMVRDIGVEMTTMSDEGGEAADQFAENVISGLTKAENYAPAFGYAGAGGSMGGMGGGMGMPGGLFGTGKPATQQVNYDFRGSVFADDKSFRNRVNRGTNGVQGM